MTKKGQRRLRGEKPVYTMRQLRVRSSEPEPRTAQVQKPQVIYAPGHYSAGDLDRPEPRL